MFLFENPSVWFAFLEIESMWGVQERLSEIVTPRYLAKGIRLNLQRNLQRKNTSMVTRTLVQYKRTLIC